jgi:hypothetical protein
MGRLTGILVGFCTLVIIGIFHPIVIKAEYAFGRKAWPAFLALGLACLGLSVLVRTALPSVLLGILGFTFLWSIRELIEQEERVRQGRFPANPKRKGKA